MNACACASVHTLSQQQQQQQHTHTYTQDAHEETKEQRGSTASKLAELTTERDACRRVKLQVSAWGKLQLQVFGVCSCYLGACGQERVVKRLAAVKTRRALPTWDLGICKCEGKHVYAACSCAQQVQTLHSCTLPMLCVSVYVWSSQLSSCFDLNCCSITSTHLPTSI